jgi:hypothetical protein
VSPVDDLVEIEHFLPESYADILEKLICRSGEFLWQYNASTNDLAAPEIMNKDARSYDSDQFVHALYQQGERRSQFFDIVFPMFYFMEDKTGVALAAVERMKANLLVQKPREDGTYNTPHVDIVEPGHKSLLYYVKDSDGDTFLFNETHQDTARAKKTPTALTIRRRVSPHKGKAVLFNSNIWHASSHPRENATRVVLNFVFSHKPLR